jgi:ribosome biogenesis GTPase / thiamine phosphate phosphatase
MMKDFDFLHIEEAFHAQERKESRKERKRISEKDRSKYKKSDQDQLKKKQQNQVDSNANLKLGRIIAVLPEGFVVSAEGILITCSLKGALKKEKNNEKNLIVIGDLVRISPDQKIVAIEERHSFLARAGALHHKKQHLIAVNIDQVLITTSIVSPPIKPTLIDRYIIAAKRGKMKPIIIINKIDLLSECNSEEAEVLEIMKQGYEEIGIPILLVSTQTQEGIDELKKLMQGKTSVFSGQSGVGKSSLINALLGSDLTIGEIVKKTQKGAHTTTNAILLPLEGGGFCIDTPGIKSFEVWEVKKEEILAGFPEIQELACHCKYLDCSHQEEPNCAVKEAADQGKISPLRFASYCGLIDSFKNDHLNR